MAMNSLFLGLLVASVLTTVAGVGDLKVAACVNQIPADVKDAFTTFPNDFPNPPAVTPFKKSALRGRYFVPATSVVSKACFFPFDCTVLDVAPYNKTSYVFSAGFWPDRSQNQVVTTPREGFFVHGENKQIAKEVIPLISPRNKQNPYYTCVLVKVGPKVKGSYRYLVVALIHKPTDTQPEGLTLPLGTISFEVYALDLEEYFKYYDDEVREFVAEQTRNNPEVRGSLALSYGNHTDCLYPFTAPYALPKKGGKKGW